MNINICWCFHRSNTKMFPHAEAIRLILHSKGVLRCWSIWRKKKRRSNGYSAPTSFSLISLSVSFSHGATTTTTGAAVAYALLCCCFFFWKKNKKSPISVASEIRHSLAASTVSRRLTERINVLLFVTITSGHHCLPCRPKRKATKAHRQALIKPVNET